MNHNALYTWKYITTMYKRININKVVDAKNFELLEILTLTGHTNTLKPPFDALVNE